MSKWPPKLGVGFFFFLPPCIMSHVPYNLLTVLYCNNPCSHSKKLMDCHMPAKDTGPVLFLLKCAWRMRIQCHFAASLKQFSTSDENHSGGFCALLCKKLILNIPESCFVFRFVFLCFLLSFIYLFVCFLGGQSVLTHNWEWSSTYIFFQNTHQLHCFV